MNIKSRMNKRIPLVLSLIAMLALMGMQLAFAVDDVRMPDLTKDTSSLQINVQYTDEKETTPIGGVELTVYKVANVTVSGGLVDYKSTPAFESVKVDYNKLTTDSSITAASQLYDAVVAGAEAEASTVTTESNGLADFGQLSNGMYLVAQTGVSGDAEDYSELKPYLVMLPQSLADVGEEGWNYEVVSIPKMEIARENITITKKVNEENIASLDDLTEKFAYDIISNVNYSPEGFAIVDNVPEELEIVDTSRIEIKVNGTRVSDEVRDSMVTIDGNLLRVEPSLDQIKEWIPFEMSIKFYCQIRDDVEVSEEGIKNVAGYEVKGVYKEPSGDDHKATVKGVNKKKTVVKRTSKVSTGDIKMLAIPVLGAVLMVSLIVIFVMAKRRRANN